MSVLKTNAVTAVTTNGNLTISPNGSGAVVFGGPAIISSSSINAQTGKF